MLDVPGLAELLRKLHRREISLVEVETPTASPFASSLLFDYVATYMYEGDTPNAERRAAALSLDRDLLRELLGQEELRDLIDPGALGAGRGRPPVPLGSPPGGDAATHLHDVLRTLGDLTAAEAAARVLDGVDAACDARRAASASAARSRSASAARSAGSTPPTPGCTATRSGWRRRAGCRRRSWRTCPMRSRGWSGATRPPTGRSRPTELRARYGVDCSAVLSRARARRRAGPRRAAPGRLRARVVRSRGAAPAAPRVAGRAAQGDRAGRPAGARAVPARAGRTSTAIRRPAPASIGCARRWSRCRGWRSPPTCGSATCCRAGSARTRRRGWTSCARAARSCGSARARSGATPGAWRCTSARTWPLLGPPPFRGAAPDVATHTTRSASGWRPARASSPICWSTSSSRPRSSRRRCGIWPGPARPPTTRSRRCGRRG